MFGNTEHNKTASQEQLSTSYTPLIHMGGGL